MSKNAAHASTRTPMINRIMRNDGKLLPIQQPAFRYSIALIKSMIGGGKVIDEDTTIQQYFESFGISFISPDPAVPGWYYCNLPSGWTVTRLQRQGLNDGALYYNGEGKHVFTIITRAKPSDTACLLTDLNPSEPALGTGIV